MIIHLEQDLQELFTDLHAAPIFSDGKALADATLKLPPQQILDAYRQQKQQPDFNLHQFVNTYFTLPSISETGYVSDTELPVQQHIEQLWEVLQRPPTPTPTQAPASTLLPLPYPYVVPGGRFNEIYYWDSYFTMLGLQVSGKVDLIENMVDNFTFLIETYGFIPNGNRSYFLSRSQPPFYSLMVDLLATEKGKSAIVDYLPALLTEYDFWMRGEKWLKKHGKSAVYRRVQIEDITLNRYYDNRPAPRAEMYTNDIELLEKSGHQARQTLTHLRAACESGWDFSSRWCKDPYRLETIHTTDILPIDLNCLLYHLEMTIATIYQHHWDVINGKIFLTKAAERKQHLQSLFWNEKTGYFHDYDFTRSQPTPALTLAGMFPLFFEIASTQQAEKCAKKIEEYFLCAGGLRTTTLTTSEQWDAPNGWAPLQWIAIKGLQNYGFTDLANRISNRWISLNETVYKKTGKLMEKYNVENINLESGGGEYPVQDGFGWTNGVLLRLLNDRKAT